MIERTFNTESIKAPALWETISEDGHDRESWEPDTNDGWLLSSDDDGQIIGAWCAERVNAITLQIHPMILPSMRGVKAHQSAREFFLWVYDNTDAQKVICSIPYLYRNVKLFAMQCGMVKEGINRSSFLKNGIIHHQWLLGITRDEIKERFKCPQ